MLTVVQMTNRFKPVYFGEPVRHGSNRLSGPTFRNFSARCPFSIVQMTNMLQQILVANLTCI